MKFLLLISIIQISLSLSIAHAADERMDSSNYVTNSKNPHDMRIVNSGVAALYARIDMIRRAKSTIELETFIFSTDTSGKILMRELAEAAKRGVKVRILVDKNSFNFELNKYYAEELKKSGVDVRYYNDASVIRLGKVQYRNHRKLMVIDDKEVITGGRNIADEYYDLSTHLNFLDRDTTIKGDIAKDMRTSFDSYWNANMTVQPEKVVIPARPDRSSYVFANAKEKADLDRQNNRVDMMEEARRKAQAAMIPGEEDKKILSYVMNYGKEVLNSSQERVCPDVTFVTDREDANVDENLSKHYSRDYRYVSREVVKWIRNDTQKQLIIDSPYFLKNKMNMYVGTHASKGEVKVKVFTNSLASTDAVHVASVFNDTISDFTPNENFDAYTFKGKYSGETKLYNDDIKNAIWGTHSKTMVFDDDAFMIGTINMDNRSVNFNSELGVFCKGSKELTAEVADNISHRMKGAYHLDAEGNPDDCSSILKDVSVSKRSLYYIMKVPSKLLESLL